MKLSAPKQAIFFIAVGLAVVSVLGHFTNISFVTANQYWLLLAGFIVLTIGNLFKGV